MITCLTCGETKRAIPGLWHESDLKEWRTKPTPMHCARCKNLKKRNKYIRVPGGHPWNNNNRNLNVEGMVINPQATARYMERGNEK